MKQIRAFQRGDLPHIQAIRKRAFQPIYDSFRALVGEGVFELEFSNWDQAQGDCLESICAQDSGKEVYVVTVGAAVVAFIGLSMNQASGRGEIDLNAVDPEHQGHGIGEFLYRFAIERMQSAGMRVVQVGTGGDASHIPARKAYEKAGFNVFIPCHHVPETLNAQVQLFVPQRGHGIYLRGTASWNIAGQKNSEH